nr:HepT-like ribonuclease domain-containing protein [Pseudanabaena sp. FACHB-2040]
MQDILDAIARIQNRVQLDQIAKDELLQVWVLYHLQIIGEATRALSSEITQRYSEVPWAQVVGLRNKVVHEYFAIDLDIVTDIVTDDLPNLQATAERILQDLENPNPSSS